MPSLKRFLKESSTRKKVGLGLGALVLVSLISSGINSNQQSSEKPEVKGYSVDLAEEENTENIEEEPIITTETETETQEIPFESLDLEDDTIAKGETVVTIAGVNGKKTLFYEVTYTDGVETGRELVREEITQDPTNQVRSIGTKVSTPTPAPAAAPAPTPQPSSTASSNNCDPNYSGCVPIASDVDCAGGSGNGPAYVSGPIKVIGSDIYGLDRDKDGIACE